MYSVIFRKNSVQYFIKCVHPCILIDSFFIKHVLNVELTQFYNQKKINIITLDKENVNIFYITVMLQMKMTP